MRYFFVLASFTCLFLHSSCARYQLYSFRSDTLPSVASKGFVEHQPEDSISLYYQWSVATNMGVIDIENKGKEMAYVDWTRSAIIVNGTKQDVFNQASQSKTTGTFEGTTWVFGNNPNEIGLAATSGTFQGNTSTFVTQSQSVVLPQSSSRYMLPAFNLGFQKSTKASPFLDTHTRGKNGQTAHFKFKRFDKKSSPMVVRFFLVYKVGNAGKERILDREFWVDEVVNAYSLNTVKMLYNDKN